MINTGDTVLFPRAGEMAGVGTVTEKWRNDATGRWHVIVKAHDGETGHRLEDVEKVQRYTPEIALTEAWEDFLRKAEAILQAQREGQ